jgi:hypothetical protein
MIRLLLTLLVALMALTPAALAQTIKFRLNEPILETSVSFCYKREDAQALLDLSMADRDKDLNELWVKLNNAGVCGTLRGWITYRSRVYHHLDKQGVLWSLYRAEGTHNLLGAMTFYVGMRNFEHEEKWSRTHLKRWT